MTQPMKNKSGLNRSFGSPIPSEADDNVPDAKEDMRGGKSTRIGVIKGRLTFRKTPVGAETTKSDCYGLAKTFGNAVPQEESRDPYKVNKNAR
jgi:hypothetical protein